MIPEETTDSPDRAASSFTADDLVVNFAGASVTGTLTLKAGVIVTGTADATDTGLIHASSAVVEED